MKRFFTYLKTELKLSVRDMNMVIFAVIMPLVIFIILGIIPGTVFRSSQRDCHLCKWIDGAAVSRIGLTRNEDS